MAIYTLPDFELISGDLDPTLREKAMEWYRKFENDELPTKRLIPYGYAEAIEKVRENIELINITELAVRIGVRKVDISRVLEGFQFEGKPYHFTFRTRVKFMDEVKKLLL